MSHTLVLALNTFREGVRDRLLSAVLTFGGVFVVGSVILAPLTLGEQSRVIRDLGLSSISLFTLLMIVLVGTTLVYREIERRTIETILTQPVARAQFIVGKFLGLYATVALSVAVLSVVYLAVVTLFAGGLDASLLLAIAMTLLEACIVTAVAILFSSIASPILSAVFTFVIFVVGHLSGALAKLAAGTDNLALHWVAKAVYCVLPALHHFDVRNSLLSGAPIPEGQLLLCFAYTVLYTSALLIVTVVIFSRRDFE